MNARRRKKSKNLLPVIIALAVVLAIVVTAVILLTAKKGDKTPAPDSTVATTQPTEAVGTQATQPVATQPSEPVSEPQSTETVAPEAESEETKPVETNPAETKPAETKPAETNPVETKPAETKPAETKPAETKPAETNPKETKPVANGEAAIYVESVQVKKGTDEVAVNIRVRNNPGILGAVLKVSVDDKVFSLAEGRKTQYPGLTLTSPGPAVDSSPYTFMLDALELTEDDKQDGTLFTVVLKVKDTAAAGTYNVELSCDKGAIFDEKCKTLQLKLENGTITIA